MSRSRENIEQALAAMQAFAAGKTVEEVEEMGIDPSGRAGVSPSVLQARDVRRTVERDQMEGDLSRLYDEKLESLGQITILRERIVDLLVWRADSIK